MELVVKCFKYGFVLKIKLKKIDIVFLRNSFIYLFNVFLLCFLIILLVESFNCYFVVFDFKVC